MNLFFFFKVIVKVILNVKDVNDEFLKFFVDLYVMKVFFDELIGI